MPGGGFLGGTAGGAPGLMGPAPSRAARAALSARVGASATPRGGLGNAVAETASGPGRYAMAAAGLVPSIKTLAAHPDWGGARGRSKRLTPRMAAGGGPYGAVGFG